MHSVEGDKLVPKSRTLFTAATHLLLSRPANILTMSKDTRMSLSGIPLAFSVSNMSVRRCESFIFVDMFSVNFAQCFSQISIDFQWPYYML